MKQKIVYIEWVDASMWGNSPYQREEAKELSLSHGFVSGFLIKEDKEKVVVGMDWFDCNDDFRNVQVYPKSGIKNACKRISY